MAPAISSTRELAIASRKRPSSPTPSESDPLADLSESPSDFETPNKPARKPAKKKARTTRAAAPPVKGEIVTKGPKAYQSEEGHPCFSIKWYKEVTKRDEFWADLKKKVPKSVWQKRFKVEVMMDLNDEGGKSGEKPTVTAGRTKKTTNARKTTRKLGESALSIDLVADLDMVEDTPIASTEVTENKTGQIQSEDSVMLSSNNKLDKGLAESIQEPAGTGLTPPKDNDDLISRALANPSTTPEQRTTYVAIREYQERTAKAIEKEIEESKRREEVRLKRTEAKERKAAKDANAAAGETEKQALDTNENGSKERQRKMFNPTKF